MCDLRSPVSDLRPPLRVWLGIADLSKASGGPAVVVQHLSELLVAAGAEVTILTSLLPETMTEITPGDKRVKVIRLAAPGRLLDITKRPDGIRDTITQAHRRGEIDVFHDFGLWLPCNHHAAVVCAVLGVPYICSPCGMLSPWAMRHKAWKKRIAWIVYQRRDLRRARVLVATAGQEVEHITHRLPHMPVALVPNGVHLPEERKDASCPLFDLSDCGEMPRSGFQEERTTDECQPTTQPRTLLFLGRIHPVKGLMNLVEAWAQIRPPGWRCVIAGPDEAGHRRELENAMKTHGILEDFSFPGIVDDQDKWRLLEHADLFVLPSFTENFGIAVAEALAAGVPVITTRGTPWEELVTRQCGWWVDIGTTALKDALRHATGLTEDERRAMGKRGRQLVMDQYAWPKIAKSLVDIYWDHR